MEFRGSREPFMMETLAEWAFDGMPKAVIPNVDVSSATRVAVKGVTEPVRGIPAAINLVPIATK